MGWDLDQGQQIMLENMKIGVGQPVDTKDPDPEMSKEVNRTNAALLIAAYIHSTLKEGFTPQSDEEAVKEISTCMRNCFGENPLNTQNLRNATAQKIWDDRNSLLEKPVKEWPGVILRKITGAIMTLISKDAKEVMQSVGRFVSDKETSNSSPRARDDDQRRR